MNAEHNGPMTVEDDIDAALKMLGETQPPAALTSRIHRSLETEAAASGQTRRGWLFWIPATCASIVTVMLAIFLQAHSTRGKQQYTVETAKVVSDSASPKPAAQPSLVPVESLDRPKISVPNGRRKPPKQRLGEYHHIANLLNYPPTRQENLLLQFAETAKSGDLQMLNPEYQAKVEAQQEAEFVSYLKSDNNSGQNGTTENTQNTQE